MIRNFYLILASSLMVMLFSHSAFGQDRPVDAGYRGSELSLGNYEAKTIDQLDQLPELILSKLNSHLESRLGKKFAARLVLSYGEIVNLDKLYKEEPDRKNEPTGAYVLTFYFSDLPKELKVYYCRIILDKDGEVVREIDLPAIAQYPYKGELIALCDAIKIAEQSGFPPERMSFSFSYDEEAESFVWIITDSQAVEPDKPEIIQTQGTYREIAINANNGAVIKIYKYSIFV
jgi:hypothetical protein